MVKKTEQPTRPDLTDDQQWLVWLTAQPENRGIDIMGLYRKMVEWCSKKRITPTRRRLLNWLAGEREAVPMTALPTTDLMQTGIEQNEPEFIPEPPCEICGKQYCLKLHREERGI